MQPRLVLGSLTAWILAACSAPTEPAAKTELKSEPKSEPKAEPKPERVRLEDAPAVPGVKVLTPVGECPPLATLPDDAPEPQQRFARTIRVLHEIACQPELFGQSTPAIFAALEAPNGIQFDISRRGASITLINPVEVGDVLAVLGVSTTNLRFVRSESPIYLVVDASGNPPVVWPPSDLRIEFSVSGRIGGPTEPQELDFDPQRKINALRILLPESMFEFQHDEFAAEALVEALKVLATADDPSKLRTHDLPSLGERYWLWAGSTTISPNRTELVASDLAEAMALPSPAHQTIRIGDTDVERLTSAGKSPFVWQGLSLDVGLSKHPGTDADLAGWIVDSVTVERAPPSP